jgi:3-octaprenyl-4-hydroxybenzoate carboxy-lyase Rift-related domain
MYAHLMKNERQGTPTPCAVVIGCDPPVPLTSVARIRGDELGVAGALRGAPLEIVPCETNELEVPAHAEIVIEGFVPPGLREPEGPSATCTFSKPAAARPFSASPCGASIPRCPSVSCGRGVGLRSVVLEVRGGRRRDVAEAGLLHAAFEEAVLAADEFILDEVGEEIDGGQLLGLRFEQGGLEADGHAGAVELPQGALQFDEVHGGGTSWVFRAMTSR